MSDSNEQLQARVDALTAALGGLQGEVLALRSEVASLRASHTATRGHVEQQVLPPRALISCPPGSNPLVGTAARIQRLSSASSYVSRVQRIALEEPAGCPSLGGGALALGAGALRPRSPEDDPVGMPPNGWGEVSACIPAQLSSAPQSLRGPPSTARNNEGLPPGWELKVSKSTGKIYYFSPATGQTLWVRPPGSSYLTTHLNTAGSASAPAPVSPEALRQQRLAAIEKRSGRGGDKSPVVTAATFAASAE